VSSLTSEVKSKLQPAMLHDTNVEAQRAFAAAPLCTTAAPALDSKPILASASLASSPATPRISVDALPLQQGSRRESSFDRRRETSTEDHGLTSTEERRESSTDSRQATRSPRATKVNLDGPTPKRTIALAEPSPPRELPAQPSRTEITNAVRRAAAGATSCDSGPQDGIVTVTFAPSGGVQSVSLVKGFGDATLNACVLRAFGRAKVPAFSGEPVKVRKTVTW
jgi:hypothetical protein